jgi:hypothetical protein
VSFIPSICLKEAIMTSRRSNKSEPVPDSPEVEAAVAEPPAEPVEEIVETQQVHAEPEAAECAETGSAADAIRHGAASARAAVGQVIPGAGRLLRKSLYSTVYGASYVVVFAALSVARLVPTNNIVGEGLRDGAAAARRDVEHEEAAEPLVMEDAEGAVAAA